MTISIEEARATHAMLGAALATVLDADTPPVRQVRYELQARYREWGDACELMEFELDAGRGRAIELVDAVTKGMELIDERRGPCRIRRKLNGGTTLHMEDPNDPDPRGWYQDFYSGSSPVVVAR